MSSSQFALGPMGLEGKRVSSALESAGKSLSVDLCELVVMAFTREQYSEQEAAGVLGVSPSVFSRSLKDPNGIHQNNALMKRLKNAPDKVIVEFAKLLADRVGLSVGIDHAKVDAAVQLADAIQVVMKVNAR